MEEKPTRGRNEEKRVIIVDDIGPLNPSKGEEPMGTPPKEIFDETIVTARKVQLSRIPEKPLVHKPEDIK